MGHHRPLGGRSPAVHRRRPDPHRHPHPLIPFTNTTSILDSFFYAEINPATGKTVRTRYLGTSSLYDTLQMVGSIAPGGVVYQGTITGVVRIANG